MLKLEPSVRNWNCPSYGAVQRNQTDRPPATPACTGSPLSLVAPKVEPVVVPAGPPIGTAEANMSLAWTTPVVGVMSQLIVKVPRAGPVPAL